MNSSTKQSQSGLRTVKRDWSAPSVNQDSDPIPWSPSPPQAAAARALTGTELRMKHIQDALMGNIASSERILASSALPNAGAAGPRAPVASGSGGQKPAASLKRPSDPTPGDAAQPPAKKRQLPTSWAEPAAEPQRSMSRSSTSASGSGSVIKIAPTAPSKEKQRMLLSNEQNQILRLVVDGQSVFYTGSAGTGKSVLLREIIRAMRQKHSKSPDAVAITASTGMAACNIGGVTIHSFAGIGLGIETAEQLATKVRKNRKAVGRWLRTKVLIIDEVSMVEADLFDKLCKLGGILHKKQNLPFGGIQIIVTGDFFQLPPVTKAGETRFAFEAETWSQAIKRTFNLSKVFRQRDQSFVDMLNEMRFGKLSQQSIMKFKALSREVVYQDGLGATELFPRREEVERSNAGRMQHLKTEQHTYMATDGGALQDPAQRDKMLANFMPPKQLMLRVDAQVMLIKNMDELLVNGSMGKVIRFADAAIYAAERGADDYTFEGSGKGGSGASGAAGAGGSGPAAKKKAPPAAGGAVWPVVQFSTPKGSVEVLMQPETWKVELPNGEVQVSRTQLPLILSWAMSIHKSQGQTLERVKVDLGKVFEKGQAYVALSRATSLEGLQVLNFDPTKVNAHPKVVAWSKTLEVVST